jgi:ribosomal protein S18 acetylase RimI-like enzyme
MLTLVAEASAVHMPGGLPPGFVACPPTLEDAESLGRLYYAAYDPGVACATAEEAIEDIRAAFQGAYGDLWLAGSWVIARDGALVAALLSVQRAPWDDTPDCPFIIELFTARPCRRQGLARALVSQCLARAGATTRPYVALRVDAANDAALRLYTALGFRQWRMGLDSWPPHRG